MNRLSEARKKRLRASRSLRIRQCHAARNLQTWRLSPLVRATRESAAAYFARSRWPHLRYPRLRWLRLEAVRHSHQRAMDADDGLGSARTKAGYLALIAEGDRLFGDSPGQPGQCDPDNEMLAKVADLWHRIKPGQVKELAVIEAAGADNHGIVGGLLCRVDTRGKGRQGGGEDEAAGASLLVSSLAGM